eukprot:CAMPEP_0176344070 /NCGR_PEP_ID=MMETSP0126-20121128/4421_1 /TAXON_ID=141414 ORGANISM="Strombidinopsis acuminatum, Strain SPMC142" /NCGR_SAMPLE_ID=MMETSP0126 /ASSEMBLY_ACC=CAM_ASM_000229 /LENGTH=60 /DNA_ID=CAMNT_0017690341 /DNA_START=3072 /DNA_END=3254 /DNA_ORIENTATION=-
MNPNTIANSDVDNTITINNGCLADQINLVSVNNDGSAYTEGVDILYYIEDTQKAMDIVWS